MKKLRKISCLLLSLVLSLDFCLPAFAISEKDQDMYDQNNIFYYDYEGDICMPTSSEISSDDVYIIGDSITVGSEAEIKAELKNATIDAAVSRQFSAGLEILRNQENLKKVVVLALGTNGNIVSSDIDEALSIVGQDRILILTTNYKLDDENIYSANNSLIKSTAEQNKNVKIADWAAAVHDNPTKYITNADGLGVHPTTDGQKLFAETIIKQIKDNSLNGGEENGGDNKLYNGEAAFSEDSLDKIRANQPFYEKSANKYHIPWQIIAVLHYREAGLKRYNPANGQGAYQLYSYTGGGSNSNAFLPAGEISDDEFQRQTDIVAKLIRENYGAGLKLDTDDDVKLFFFRYNGTASAYIAQARDLGFSEAEANRGEGSPYVMNLADEKRDSRKNSNWRQITSDGGGLSGGANMHPGAFVLYAALGGSTGSTSCKSNSSGNGDLNETAIKLAWPDYGHNLNARDTYKTALSEVGLSSYGDRYAQIGASCDAFVATVFRYSGVDPDFKCCGVSNNGATWSYVVNSGKFEEVPNNAASLKPGDIRLSNGHIELYIEVDGVGKIASASYGERTGEIGPFYDNAATFKAYRWKGN